MSTRVEANRNVHNNYIHVSTQKIKCFCFVPGADTAEKRMKPHEACLVSEEGVSETHRLM